jgi:tripartite tricarboxylate transporter family receptor
LFQIVITKRKLVAASLAALANGIASAGPASADSYPSRAVRIVVPYSAGGITDILGRALAQKVSEAWGQPFIVENKPAGGGLVGVEYVAKSPADGYTLLVSADATFVTDPHTHSKLLPYDPINDFAPISGLGVSPQALVVHPSVPVKTFADLIALGKQKPGTLNYGTFGIGTSGHLNIVLIEQTTGAKCGPRRGAGHCRPLGWSRSGDDRQHWVGGPTLASRPAQSARFWLDRTDRAIPRRADAGRKWTAWLSGWLMTWPRRAEWYAAGCRRKAERAGAENLQRSGIQEKISRSQFHIFDRFIS